MLGYDCKFSDGLHGNLLAVGDEEGSVHFLDTRKALSEATINSMHSQPCRGAGVIEISLLSLPELSCHNNSVNSIAWITGGARLVSQQALLFFKISQPVMFYLADSVE